MSVANRMREHNVQTKQLQWKSFVWNECLLSPTQEKKFFWRINAVNAIPSLVSLRQSDFGSISYRVHREVLTLRLDISLWWSQIKSYLKLRQSVIRLKSAIC